VPKHGKQTVWLNCCKLAAFNNKPQLIFLIKYAYLSHSLFRAVDNAGQFLSARQQIYRCDRPDDRHSKKKTCTFSNNNHTHAHSLQRRQGVKCLMKDSLQAIASRNQLKTVAKQRESQQQQLRALIAERRAELERYDRPYEYIWCLVIQLVAGWSKLTVLKLSPKFLYSFIFTCNIAKSFQRTKS